jgi:hypothetical protein
MNNFIFLLLTLVTTLAYGGKNDSIPKFYKLGLILNGNIGIQNSGNYNFISSNSQVQGQDLLGAVGQSGELGLEFLFFFKNGLAIKGDIHSSRLLFGPDRRGDQSQGNQSKLDGNWFGSGKSIGIGYHALLRDVSSHFFLSSNLSFGSYTSKWTFSNNGSTGYPNFGDVVIGPESQESFISNNYYLDINILAGFPLIKNKNAFFNYSFSIGYRQSVHSTIWTRDVTNERINNLNNTLMMGWYVKFSLGIGFISKT